MAPQPWIFTSPSSRGIGLQLTRHLLKATNLPVIATARTDISGTKERILDGLDVDKERLEVLKVDVTSEHLCENPQITHLINHQMNPPYLPLPPTANPAFLPPPIIFASHSAFPVSFTPRNPLRKSTTSMPSKRSKSIPSALFSSWNISLRSYLDAPQKPPPFPTSLLLPSSP